MDRKLRLFVILGLLVSAVLAAFVSPRASQAPDGLERVTNDLGIGEEAGKGGPAKATSPLPDYSIPGIKGKALSTGLAAVIGTLVTFAVGFGAAKAIAAWRKR